MRSQLKAIAERAIIGSGIERVMRRNRDHGALVLAYHNVVADGSERLGDSSLHLALDEFVRQIDVLADTCEVVSLESLLEPATGAGLLRVAITFDDAYSGALALAIPELSSRSMPATIFVAPGMLDTVPWWDIVAEPATGVVSQPIREHAIEVLAGRRDAVLEWVARSTTPHADSTALPHIATFKDLYTAAGYNGVTLGAHSWSHPNLAAVTPEEMEAELSRPLQWLRERFTNVVPFLSYPYGRYSQPVESAASATGYDMAFRVEGGRVPGASIAGHRFALPRLNVAAGMSTNGFRLRLAGLGRAA